MGKIKKAGAQCSDLCVLSDFPYPFKLWDDLFVQPLAYSAAIQPDKIVHANLHQPLATDQVKAGYLAVFIVEAAAVNQVFNPSGVQIRKRDDSAAGLIRPPVQVRRFQPRGSC